MSNSKIDAKIKILNYIPSKEYQESEMQILFQGKSIDNSIINALRRISLEEIPTYAFHPDTFNITYNDTVRNNDMLFKTYFCQFCIPNLKHDVVILPRKYWDGVDYKNPKREKHSSDKKDIEIVVNVHNDTTVNMFVNTSEHLKYYEDGELIKNKIKKDQSELIAELRPNETIRFSAKAVIGVNVTKGNGIFAAARSVYFERLDEEGSKNIDEDKVDYKLVIHSLGQLSELEIMKRSCKILVKKLDDLKTNVHDKVKKVVDISTRLNLDIENESHTLGNLIQNKLQEHPKIIGASYTKRDLLVPKIQIQIETDTKKDDPVQILNQVIEDLKNLFENLHDQFKKQKEI